MPTITVTLDYEVQAGVQWGACPPPPGGTSATAAQTAATKWGTCYIRQFMGSTLDWPAVPTGCLMHRSYKPAETVTDAQIDALLQAAVGHYVTFWHEPDNDGLTSTARTARIALMNRLYDRNVALGRPCTIVPTFTGGMFASYGTQANRDLWNTVKGDVLGIDFDGVHDDGQNPGRYSVNGNNITYADEVANGKTFIQANASKGWQGIAGPEWGISRAAWDTTGQGRADWMSAQAQIFIDNGLEAVAWYDFAAGGKTDVIDPGTPEYTVLQDLVATN